jgi:hypothetical protein
MEQAIEERLKKRLEEEFKKSYKDLEEKAMKGMQ